MRHINLDGNGGAGDHSHRVSRARRSSDPVRFLGGVQLKCCNLNSIEHQPAVFVLFFAALLPCLGQKSIRGKNKIAFARRSFIPAVQDRSGFI
jgi:hypothetical protein